MAPKNWYFSRDGEIQGPFSSTQLKQHAEAGRLRPTDLVQQQGMAKWVAAANVKGLFAAGQAAPPGIASGNPSPPPTPAQLPPPELPEIPAPIEGRVREFVEAVPALYPGRFFVDLAMTMAVLALIGTPIAGWLVLWLGAEVEFLPALFGGLCGGLVVGVVLTFILTSIHIGTELLWKYRCVVAAENHFRELFPPQSRDYSLALRSLVDQASRDETGVAAAVANDLQFAPRGEPPPASFHPSPAAVERMKQLAGEMQPHLNKAFGYDVVQLEYRGGDEGFDAAKLPLPPGETAVFTIDPCGARGMSAPDGPPTAIVTDRRVILCRSWAETPVAWVEAPFDQVVRMDRAGDSCLLFHCLDGSVVVWQTSRPKELGALLTRIVSASGSPVFRAASESPDLEAVKQGIEKELVEAEAAAAETPGASAAAKRASQGRVRCPSCRSAKIAFKKGSGVLQREALSWTGAIAGGLLFGAVGAMVGSNLGAHDVDRFRCLECEHEFPLDTTALLSEPDEPSEPAPPGV